MPYITMPYIICDLPNLEEQTILAAIEACPKSETSLRFARDTLRGKTATELQPLFKALPTQVTEVDLSSNRLAQVEDLEQAIASLPRQVSILDLSDNGLATVAELEQGIRVMSAIPDTVCSINLSHNGLSRLGLDEVRRFFEAIKPSIQSIHLKGEQLGQKGFHLASFLKLLPQSLTSLDIGFNDLGEMNVDHFIAALKAIPEGVKLLDLKGHFPLRFKRQELVKIMQNLPRHIHSLDVSGNHLSHIYSVDELQLIIEAIPDHLKSLDLRYNALGNQASNDLKKVFKTFPDTLRSVNLRSNGFDTKSKEDLNSIYNNLPKYVHLNAILDNYLEKREKICGYNDQPLEYFYYNFFNCFHKTFSLTEKRNAILALKSVINGNDVDLTPYIPALENGSLGQALQEFTAYCHTKNWIPKDITTVKGFVQYLPIAVATDDTFDARLDEIVADARASVQRRHAHPQMVR